MLFRRNILPHFPGQAAIDVVRLPCYVVAGSEGFEPGARTTLQRVARRTYRTEQPGEIIGIDESAVVMVTRRLDLVLQQAAELRRHHS